MTLWKKAVALLLAATMMVPLALAAPSAEGSFSDVEDHWAQAEIEKAVATGWVDGYPDGTFKPEKTITRAEFTKMILDAIHLTPGCETVEWMVDTAKRREGNYGTTSYEPRLNDMNDHWLTTQGWTEAALYSGMVVPSDYNGGNFRPEKPIARYEIALMVTRALGQVIEANLEEGLNLSFTDNEDILDWMKGYVHMASEAGVVRGYPDGSFQPNKASTRAEAVVMVQRMLDVMEEGLDPDIHLVVQYQDKNGTTVVRDRPSLTMQVVDGMDYIPVRGLFELQADMMKEAGSEYAGYWGQFWYALWWPVEQICCVENTLGNEPLVFNYQMGTDHYFNDNLLLGVARSLYGEVMIPVCDLNHPDSEVQDNWYQDNWHGAWDGESNTLTLSLRYHAPTLV